jgi:hypothetical protein
MESRELALKKAIGIGTFECRLVIQILIGNSNTNW